jgi:3-phenylpropionate/trans-cinnamate dioxygenase ferredoxin reductase subunit
MTIDKTVVILGAGQAGSELAFALRQCGHLGRIILVGSERHEPYQRPPLSKSLLKGSTTQNDVRVRSAQAYSVANIELVLGQEAVMVDRHDRTVQLANGETLRYDKLALTLGGRPRPLDFGPPVGTASALYTLDDALAMQAMLRTASSLVVVGGGFIGMEVAAAAAAAGVEVSVVESAERVMQRTCAPAVSDHFTALHESHGVSVKTGVSVVSARRSARGLLSFELSDGSTVHGDAVVAGIGQTPNDELAGRAGLAVDEGIVVDSTARTSDPDIVAAGDCTRQEHAFLRRSVRLESQHNAAEQARAAARAVCELEPAPAAVPWFWSEQYDSRVQMAGVPDTGDRSIVRGDPTSGSFSVVYLRANVLTGVHAVNRPNDFAAGRKLIGLRTPIESIKDITRVAALIELAAAPAQKGA